MLDGELLAWIFFFLMGAFVKGRVEGFTRKFTGAFYSIFTNDLPYALDKSSVIMYADDSTMYSAA